MADHIWTIRNADGELRGVGMTKDEAILCADIDDDVRDAFNIGCGSPHNGYTLTREPLPAPVAASEPVAWEAKYQNARQVIADLCEGRRSWIMSIPARPDVDPDLVISDALEAMRQALIRPSAAAGGDLRFVEVCAFDGLLPYAVTVLRRLGSGGRIRGSEDCDALAWLASRLQWAMDQETAAPVVPVVTEAIENAFMQAYKQCETENGLQFTHRMGINAGIAAAITAASERREERNG